MEQQEIKKCPFCSGGAVVKSFTSRRLFKSVTAYYIKCTVCGNQSALELSITDTANKWNRRSEV